MNAISRLFDLHLHVENFSFRFRSYGKIGVSSSLMWTGTSEMSSTGSEGFQI